MTRLAVLGSPIAHSKSPALHLAAYCELGLDWDYQPIDLVAVDLPAFLSDRGTDWRGLSLTMPLKQQVIELLDWKDATASLTGAANTVLFEPSTGGRALRGYNTDVAGIAAAFRDAGVADLGRVRILGAGATAASALVAVAGLGAERVSISARSTSRLVELMELGEKLGVVVVAAEDDEPEPDAVISTLPGGSENPYRFSSATRASSVLLDVAYDPWPSPLVTQWQEVRGRVIPGIDMLINQALVQVRIFVGGDPDTELPGEAGVLRAMRLSVGA